MIKFFLTRMSSRMGDKPDSYTGISLCVMTTSAEDYRIPHTKTGEWGRIKLLVTDEIERVILHLEINPAMYLKSIRMIN